MIQDDISKYPCYVWEQKRLKLIPNLKYWNNLFQLHHFIKQNVRKTNPDFYSRVEHLQKLLLLPRNMHYDLHAMGSERFKEKYGVNKDDFLFSRTKWREGYYEEREINKS